MGRRSEFAPPRNEWSKRVNPVFVKYWSAQKAMRNVSKIKDADRRQLSWRHAFQELAIASRQLNEEQARVKRPIAPHFQKALYARLDGEGSFRGKKVGTAYALNPEAD